MTRSIPLTLSLLILFATALAGHAEPHVILVSVDGMRPETVDVLGPDGAPTFHRLRREGAFTGNARTDVVYTITLPNHTSMVTSRAAVGPEGHSWISNTDPKLGENLHRNHKGYLSSFFAVAHDHGLSTALYASKSKFSLYDVSYDDRTGAPDETGEDNGRDKIDRYVANEETDQLIDELIASLAKEPAAVTMLHLRDPDSAGHAEGWILEKGTPYLDAVAKVDGYLGRLLGAIESNPAMKGNTWLVITADHGGLTGSKGHGEARESDNFIIPFYVWGPGVPPGGDLYALNPDSRQDPGKENPPYDASGQPIRNGDAGNLILSLLKLPAIPGSTINAKQDLKVLAPEP